MAQTTLSHRSTRRFRRTTRHRSTHREHNARLAEIHDGLDQITALADDWAEEMVRQHELRLQAEFDHLALVNAQIEQQLRNMGVAA